MHNVLDTPFYIHFILFYMYFKFYIYFKMSLLATSLLGKEGNIIGCSNELYSTRAAADGANMRL